LQRAYVRMPYINTIRSLEAKIKEYELISAFVSNNMKAINEVLAAGNQYHEWVSAIIKDQQNKAAVLKPHQQDKPFEEKPMKQIWKYELVSPFCEFNIPEGAEVLSAQLQGAAICLWVLVDPAAPVVTRRFLYGTGWSGVKEAHKFIATVQGEYVWHVFEEVITSPA
jgi:hypothetical protein